eukprot:g2651.t1
MMKKKKKKKRKKKRRKSADNDTGSDSSDAFSDSDSDSDSDGSSDASSASERVLTVDEVRQQQFRRARQAASRAADEYNELLHRLVGLIAYVRRKQVELPHFQMLPEQTPESILNFVERRSRDVARWELFIEEWKGEFIGKCKARCNLLETRKANLRCFSAPLNRRANNDKNIAKWNDAFFKGKSQAELDAEAKLERERRKFFRMKRLEAKRELQEAREQETAHAAALLQRLWRKRSAGKRIQDLIRSQYEKVYDPTIHD